MLVLDAVFGGLSSSDRPSIPGSPFLLGFSPVQTTAEPHYALALRHGNENLRPFGVLDSSLLARSGSPSKNFSSWHAPLTPAFLGVRRVRALREVCPARDENTHKENQNEEPRSNRRQPRTRSRPHS